MPVIATDPILPSIEVPTLFVKEPRIIEFERQNPLVSCFNTVDVVLGNPTI